MRELKAKGATLRAMEQPVETSTATGKAFLDMLGVLAEFETNLRRERQMEGIAKAKTNGVYESSKRSMQCLACIRHGISHPRSHDSSVSVGQACGAYFRGTVDILGNGTFAGAALYVFLPLFPSYRTSEPARRIRPTFWPRVTERGCSQLDDRYASFVRMRIDLATACRWSQGLELHQRR